MAPTADLLKHGDVRKFEVVYTARVPEVPEGTKVLRVWVPVPQDGPVQAIGNLKVGDGGGVKAALTTEMRFGNRLAYFEVKDPRGPFEAALSYTVTRKELLTDLPRVGDAVKETDAGVAEFLKPDRLVVVDDRIRRLAAGIVKGKTTTLEKARAIYDHVADHMSYDRSGVGWGEGDTNFACDVGRGNCTDFHALFLSLCRAEGIPAGFEIGLFPPYEAYRDQALGGYHCWAFFRVAGKTWVPVDISEGDRDPGRLDYFFGNLTSNRVTLSVGRDLILEPAQAGPALNYLLNPYAEADGRKVATAKDWQMKDLQ